MKKSLDPIIPASGDNRWVSLDVVRGFDMFWIIGAGSVVAMFSRITSWRGFDLAAEQLTHVDWEGLRAFDVIFPLFLFVAGAALPFSLARFQPSDQRRGVLRLGKRLLLLFFLGVFVNGGFSKPIEDVRWMGVLQRIGLATFFAGLVILYWPLRRQIVLAAGLLIGYWLLLRFVPPPGGTPGDFSEGRNLADWIDAQVLPGRKYLGKPHDPEGILSTLPAIVTALLGAWSTLWVRYSGRCFRTSAGLIVGGLTLWALGRFWSLDFPVIKKIWTSSFVLETAGWSAILLGVAHVLIDVLGWRCFVYPWIWIGERSLLMYLAPVVLNLKEITDRLIGGSIRSSLGEAGEVLHRAGPLLLMSGLAAWLHHARYRPRV